MARRSPQTVVKRAREQALREKRERKAAKKEARAAERLNPTAEGTPDELEPGETPETGEAEPDSDPAEPVEP